VPCTWTCGVFFGVLCVVCEYGGFAHWHVMGSNRQRVSYSAGISYGVSYTVCLILLPYTYSRRAVMPVDEQFSNNKLHYCLSNAMHSIIGQNIKSLECPVSDVPSPAFVDKTA